MRGLSAQEITSVSGSSGGELFILSTTLDQYFINNGNGGWFSGFDSEDLRSMINGFKDSPRGAGVGVLTFAIIAGVAKFFTTGF